MSSYFLILIVLNILWSGYLTILLYKKNKSKNTNQQSIVNNELLNTSISKIKLFRFNPFDDVGSDQSFILVLLNNNNSGVLITSLHNRSSTRIYAKNIKNGQADDIALSKEEKSAIIEAINN
jgi:hypothetical protein